MNGRLWSVNIDSTELWVSSLQSNLDATTTFCSQEEAEGNGFQKLQQQEGGNGYFSIHGPKPHPSTSQSDNGEKNIMGPIFTTTLDVSNLASPGDSVLVVELMLVGLQIGFCMIELDQMYHLNFILSMLVLILIGTMSKTKKRMLLSHI